MKRISFFLIAPALLLGACTTTVVDEQERELPEVSASFSGDREITVDYAQSFVAFIGKSNIINHEGRFDTFDVTFMLDEEDPADLTRATIVATIETASVRSDPGVTDHMRREDFFDVEQYPVATFVTTSISRVDGNFYELHGDLTIKGETREAAFDAEITDAYMTASYNLPRREFRIGNDAYGDKLLDPIVPVEVKLVFE